MKLGDFIKLKEYLFSEKIIRIIGIEKSISIFKEVQRIEKDGGMLIMNQTRRRTPGGVYFFLVKHDNDLTAEQTREIFEDSLEKFRVEAKEKKKQKRLKMKAEISEKMFIVLFIDL